MVELKHVTKTYPTKNGLLSAVNDVSFTINQGEIFGIIGYSGSGKTTLLRLMCGLEQQCAGKVLINNCDLNILKGKEKRLFFQELGVVFQGVNLFYQKNVFKNIAFPLEIARVNKQEIKRRVKSLLELTGISDKYYAYPAELSGGQQQRVAIARALAFNPKILFLDEFTSALDIETQKQILDLLVKVKNQEDVTICLITHDLNVVKSITDRVAVMHNGKLIEIGATEDVVNNPNHKVTKLLVGDVK